MDTCNLGWGTTWTTKKITGGDYSPGCEVFFINDRDGWSNFGQDRIFSTNDGGKTWNKLKTIPESFETRSFFWANQNEGWFAGYVYKEGFNDLQYGTGAVFKTVDGGESWTEVNVEKNAFYDLIRFSDQQNGLLVSRDDIFLTSDGGVNWKKLYSLPNLSND